MSENGNGILTSDPLTILNYIKIQHPIGAILREIAFGQKSSVGTVSHKLIDVTIMWFVRNYSLDAPLIDSLLTFLFLHHDRGYQLALLYWGCF